MRYAWDLQHQYLRETGLDTGIRGALTRLVLHRMRLWDLRTANGVDRFIAISHFIERRIRKLYRRESTVIYPPVDVERFTPGGPHEDFYVTASRMVPYKRMNLIVDAFTAMPERQLVVIGDGPEAKRIRAGAGSNVRFLGHQPFEVLRDHLRRARAFVFAAEEDFGIAPLEAQACGTPVIAYGKGRRAGDSGRPRLGGSHRGLLPGTDHVIDRRGGSEVRAGVCQDHACRVPGECAALCAGAIPP